MRVLEQDSERIKGHIQDFPGTLGYFIPPHPHTLTIVYTFPKKPFILECAHSQTLIEDFNRLSNRISLTIASAADKRVLKLSPMANTQLQNSAERPCIRRIHLEPQTGTSFLLECGQSLRVIDVQGMQVSDLIAFNATDIREWLSSGRSLDYANTIYFTTGHTLYSQSQHTDAHHHERYGWTTRFPLHPVQSGNVQNYLQAGRRRQASKLLHESSERSP